MTNLRSPIYIDESAALNPLDLRARARRLHRQYGGLGLIVVDYLQLMSVSGAGYSTLGFNCYSVHPHGCGER